MHDDSSTVPFDAPYNATNLGVFGEPAAHGAGLSRYIANGGSAIGDDADTEANSDSSNSSNNNSNNARHQHAAATHSPHNNAANGAPTGMAARFGRWLPTRPSTQSTKVPVGRLNNATRLRPSSRKSSHYNYASDDGMHLGYAAVPRTPSSAQVPAGTFSRATTERYLYSSTFGRGGTAKQQQALLLQSPSSPSQSPNPWVDAADTRLQARRHALSDSSLRPARDTSSQNGHKG
ncbi:hypothetical protein LPJ66_007856 [Kickxella alabastrina]|uniref:Uncharacterized protein n=1 Tax=Kickxella alabastrina TaxID=61397 RepID=A0ACC1IBF4_9FUNG|nr:hypothetical protein LPJ66_007856 [Kickxella alabastrina]